MTESKRAAGAAANAHAHRLASIEIERSPAESGIRERGSERVEEVNISECERVFDVTDGYHHCAAAVAPAGFVGCDA